MRKNSLKRIFAALALSAVATASVAAVPAYAEGDTTTDSSTTEEAAVEGPTADGGFYYKNTALELVYLSADEIGAASVKPTVTVDTVTSEAGAEVTLKVSVDTTDWNSTGIHVNYDSANLELVKAAYDIDVLSNLTTKRPTLYDGGAFFTTAGDIAAGTTAYAELTFKVTDAAQPGDFYPVTIDFVPGDIFSSTTVDATNQTLMTAYTYTQGIVNGGVQIPELETTTTTVATTTTEAAPAATTTTVVTTTAKPAETTTTTGPKTDAPATGVNGVGLAAAGIVAAAGVAFVLRKKED